MSNNFVDISKFIVKGKIDSYYTNDIYKVHNKENGKEYAAIISSDEIDEKSLIGLNTILNVSNVISKMNHPSIANFIGYSPIDFTKKQRPVMFFDLYQQSLEIFLKDQKNSLNANQKLDIIFYIASGMFYLHSNQIIHRNLNTRNILLDENLKPKIFGLDLAITKKETNKSLGIEGMPIYISPEIWIKGEYSEASDVYAFSIILYQIMTKQIPFQNLKVYEIYQKVTSNERPDLKSHILPESIKNLIESCWSQDPKKDHLLHKLSIF